MENYKQISQLSIIEDLAGTYYLSEIFSALLKTPYLGDCPKEKLVFNIVSRHFSQFNFKWIDINPYFIGDLETALFRDFSTKKFFLHLKDFKGYFSSFSHYERVSMLEDFRSSSFENSDCVVEKLIFTFFKKSQKEGIDLIEFLIKDSKATSVLKRESNYDYYI